MISQYNETNDSELHTTQLFARPFFKAQANGLRSVLTKNDLAAGSIIPFV